MTRRAYRASQRGVEYQSRVDWLSPGAQKANQTAEDVTKKVTLCVLSLRLCCFSARFLC